MAQRSVLTFITKCLSVMESDRIDDINDTEESRQLQELLRDVYLEYCERQSWRWLQGTIDITSPASAANPTAFTVGSAVKHILDLKYNIDESGTNPRFKPLDYKEPEEFLRIHGTQQTTSSTLLVTPLTGIQLYVFSDRMPSYWTSLDDRMILMDSYNVGVEAFLALSKLSRWGESVPTLDATFTNASVLTFLPEYMEPTLQHEFNQAAFAYFKQTASPTDAVKALRQTQHSRRTRGKTPSGDVPYGNAFGRK